MERPIFRLARVKEKIPFSELPGSLTLPPLVYETALSMINDTVRDGIEYGTHVKYGRRGELKVLPIIKGESHSVRKHKGVTTKTLFVATPGFDIHTHPTVPMDEIEMALRAPDAQDWMKSFDPPITFEDARDRLDDANKKTGMYPSGPDLSNFLSSKDVNHLTVSEGGLVLLLRVANVPFTEKIINDQTGHIRARLLRYAEFIRLTNNQDLLDELRAELVTAISPYGALYFTEDPKGSGGTLQKFNSDSAQSE